MNASQRRIVVTGAGRGLGRALALRFAARGDAVWATTRDDAPVEGAAGTVHLDHRDEASIIAAAAQVAGATDGIDVLINCAGTDARSFGAYAARRGPFDLGPAEFDAVLQVNVTGPMMVTRHFLELLRGGTDAMIVNVSSQLGSMQVASRMGNDTAYCVSKAALNMLSVKTARHLEGDGIGVVMLHPGWLNTDMGGPNAALDVDATADVIVDTIGNLSLADTGRFIRWDGQEHPW